MVDRTTDKVLVRKDEAGTPADPETLSRAALEGLKPLGKREDRATPARELVFGDPAPFDGRRKERGSVGDKRDAGSAGDQFIRSGKAKNPDAAPLASAYGAVKALELLKDKMPGKWRSLNGNQDQLLDLQKALRGDLSKIPTKILDGKASTDTNELNKFLKDHGYNIKLKPITKDGIGVVTTTELEGKWRGKKTKDIESDGKKYPAFKLKTDEIYTVGDKTVAKIYDDKASGIKVFVAPYDGKAGGLDASEIAKKMIPGADAKKAGYDSIALPEVDMDRTMPLTWMLGMQHSSGRRIEQAMAQTQVKMNKDGFKAKEAVAMVAGRGMEQEGKTLTVDKPFMFIVMKDGVPHPLFATTIDQKYWKSPKKDK